VRRYETIFITHPDLSEEDQNQLLEKIRSLMGSLKAEIIRLDDWGQKKLSYEIRKNNRGRYFLMDYVAAPEVVREWERNLRLNDRILKYQTVKLSDEMTPEAARNLKEQVAAVKPPEAATPPPAPAPAPAPTSGTEETKAAEPQGGEAK
jgi:small subunit ribosomal protein S6